MTRRSTSQKLISERQFRVRIRLPVPTTGLGQTLNDLHAWLDQRVGRGNYAVHCHRDIGREDELAVYLHEGEVAGELEQWFKAR